MFLRDILLNMIDTFVSIKPFHARTAEVWQDLIAWFELCRQLLLPVSIEEALCICTHSLKLELFCILHQGNDQIMCVGR